MGWVKCPRTYSYSLHCCFWQKVKNSGWNCLPAGTYAVCELSWFQLPLVSSEQEVDAASWLYFLTGQSNIWPWPTHASKEGTGKHGTEGLSVSLSLVAQMDQINICQINYSHTPGARRGTAQRNMPSILTLASLSHKHFCSFPTSALHTHTPKMMAHYNDKWFQLVW